MIAVVIPCYKVGAQILSLLPRIGSEVNLIFVVDDKCPENSGMRVKEFSEDPRVQVLFNKENLGVGGTVLRGYQEALRRGAQIIVKLDGDGQMDPQLIPQLVRPIERRRADYTKGNRFYFLDDLDEMPALRLFGNTVLSFINKLVSGYWDIMDPTNGFTAIHRKALEYLPLEKIEKRYFFESDMLFRLSTLRATVADVPMRAKYGDEKSSLQIWRVLVSFPGKYLKRFVKRVFYNYFLRDFNFGSLMLISSLALLGFGGWYGGGYLIGNWHNPVPAPSGVVMAAAVPVILGFQSLLMFFLQDVASVPRLPLQD